MYLFEHLEICPGVTAVIGGGGKTSLLRVLGKELSGAHRVLLCTTTKILPFSGIPCAKSVGELETLRKTERLICAGCTLPGSEKLIAPEISMTQLAEWFDYVLVEADGSAQRPLKAHAPHEPVIPPESNQTICVVGASGFGKTIAEAAHRPERYAQLAGVSESALASPETEAAVLLAEALQDKVYVNQVETDSAMEAAQQLAECLNSAVLAGSLRQGVCRKCWY